MDRSVRHRLMRVGNDAFLGLIDKCILAKRKALLVELVQGCSLLLSFPSSLAAMLKRLSLLAPRRGRSLNLVDQTVRNVRLLPEYAFALTHRLKVASCRSGAGTTTRA
jgi:hypothetical protein